MSLTKSTTRRGSLLAGSSLVAASLAAAASLGATFAPSAAFAANECTPTGGSGATPAANATAADTYECAASTYAAGVTYDAVGNLTVTKTGSNTMTNTANGVNLTADGTEALTWNSVAGNVIGGNGTAGPVVSLTSTGSGAITVTAGTVSGTSSTATHGIFAQSTGGGNVSVTASGSVNPSGGTTGGSTTSNANATTGIEARSTGGNGDVTVTLSNANAQGRLYGIRAEASGSGDLTIDLQGSGNATPHNVNNGDPTSAAIYAKTGTGLLTIDVEEGLSNSGGTRNASAIRLETAGDAVINVGYVRTTGIFNPIFDMTTTAGTTTVLTHSSGLGGSAGSGPGPTDAFLFRGEGGSDLTIHSGGVVAGFVDFSEQTGDVTWNINERWATQDAANSVRTAHNIFGSGDDTITIGAEADWLVGLTGTGGTQIGNETTLETTLIEFGDGEDRLVNNGTMMVGPKSVALFFRYVHQDKMEAEARLMELEVFENAGTIYFGGSALPGEATPVIGSPELGLQAGSYATGPDYAETDYTADDVLTMPGTHWVGAGESRLVLDVVLNANQPACDVSLRDMTTTTGPTGVTVLTGDMPAADCMGLQGGSTEGVTKVLINQLGGGDRGGPLRIVLVDVAGGESGAGHFILDPMNHGYIDSEEGGYLDVGYFIVPLVYDADTQQHILLGSAGPNAWQTATWATAAHELWRASTGSWFDRQADLRGDLPDGVGGGIWLRTSGDVVKRDVEQFQQSGTTTFTFDNSYEQETYAVTGGIDLMVGGGADSAFVVGLMAGYANSKVEYDPSPNTAQLDSWNGGLYASYLAGGLYVDAALSANKAEIEADIQDLNLFPTGTVLSTPFLSVGVQVEGGYRFPLSDSFFVEPLAGVSWVRTKWEELTVPSADPLRPGVDVDFGDPVSLRGNVGARVGVDQDYGAFRAQYSLLGRVWNEAEGEHELTLGNVVDDVFVGDELTGAMSELGLGASIYGGVVSGFLNVGGKWADDYESVGGSVGVRVAW